MLKADRDGKTAFLLRGVRMVQAASFVVWLGVFSGGVQRLSAQSAAPSTRVLRSAPNFARFGLDHKKIELSSYRGKVVLLNFWATWCGPCLTEMPTFNEWQRRYGPEKFQVIGISMDDAVPEVVAARSKLKLTYPVVMGEEHLGAAYGGVLGLPVTILVDRKGKIRTRYDGAADLPRMQREIESLLVP